MGKNGCGKSTLLDALSYGLFGKPHRNVNKPQLLNSINKKDLVVEIEFTSGKSRYKIIRGMNPHIFEIYKNDKLVNQASSVRDYQAYLEQTILKFTYKTFSQVVILGSSNFVPFMQLPTGQRRQIIEDLLDINIFTKMNQLLKEEHSKVKEELRNTEGSIEVIRQKIKIQTKYISDLESLNKGLIASKQQEVSALSDEYEVLEGKAEKLEKILGGAKAEYNRRDKSTQSAVNSAQDQFKAVRAEAKNVNKILQFFTENDSCPVCTQPVDDEVSSVQIEKCQHQLDDITLQQAEAEKKLSEIENRRVQLREVWSVIEADSNKLSNYQNDMKSIRHRMHSLNKDIAELYEKSGDVDEARQELKALEQSLEDQKTERIRLNEQINYNLVKFEMLKDTGIKTKIIRKYLPVMNNHINQYLQTLDFFVQFTLDENFKEVIRSRHRDDFSYTSFSEGEKSRIDLALLFTWRLIAQMKNSIRTNLLILDETFDSSIDEDGVENLMKIFDTLDQNTNVFVISHKRDLLDSKFPTKLTFVKKNNFSSVVKD